MISIFLFSFLSTLFFLCCGIIFYRNDKVNFSNLNILVILGAVIISFISVSINYFLPLDKNINTIIFILINLIGIFLIIYKRILYLCFLVCILSSLICTLILLFDTIYRPDASMYHLPYTKIINDSKLIFGISNVHFRFGHTSILQYLNASLYNYFFLEKGILLPAAIIFSSINMYFTSEIYKNVAIDKIYSFFIFLILTYVLYGFNRYSEFGNDTIAHLIFLLITTFIVKKDFISLVNYKLFNKILILSLFCFALKSSLILIFLIPAYIFIKYFKKNFIFNFANIFAISFILIWLIKNLLISGCLIYPIEITCFEKLAWLSNDTSFNISPKFQSLDNQAWSKGWSNYYGEEIKREDYVKNFFWLKTWGSVHGLLIFKKLIIYVLLITGLFIVFKNIDKKKIDFSIKISNEVKFLLLLALIGTLIWFLRFPLYRYGSSYIILLLVISVVIFCFKNNFNKKKDKIFKKFINIFLISFLVLFISKHILRIYKNINMIPNKSVWPEFYSNNNINKEFRSEAIYINGKIAYYLLKEGFGCGYTSSPCSPYEMKDVKIYEKKGYKFYVLDN